MTQPDDKPFLDFLWGVERETHRMLPSGHLSPQPHPEALRVAPFTRDFAECMLEIVTAPVSSIPGVVAELDRLTGIAQAAVEPERLWPFSMPPGLPDPSGVPVAALGRRAVLYREGLALRHGKARQLICGVHLNVSFGSAMTDWLARNAPLGEAEDSFLIRLARNLYQDLPLFSVLFGASPVAADSARLAVSHRNGPTGYARSGFLSYLDLSSTRAYIDGIRRGLRTASQAFSALGLVRDGQVLQLNGNVFQTEKEFYAPIRLRQVAGPGESGLQALSRRGAGYLELRFFDVDPFHPAGVSEEGLRLMHLFILDGLTRATAPQATGWLEERLARAAEVARMDPLQPLDPDLLGALRRRLEGLGSWALALDRSAPGGGYLRSLEAYRSRVVKPWLLPSARLARHFEASGMDWTTYGMQIAGLQKKGVSHALDYAGV